MVTVVVIAVVIVIVIIVVNNYCKKSSIEIFFPTTKDFLSRFPGTFSAISFCKNNSIAEYNCFIEVLQLELLWNYGT